MADMTASATDLTAGARAMYEAKPELVSYSEPLRSRTWEELPESQQGKYIRVFSAGVAAMPDHSAELLEALAVFLDDPAIQVSIGGNPVYADQRLGFAHDVYAKARARKGEA